jgi:basic membrane protein A
MAGKKRLMKVARLAAACLWVLIFGLSGCAPKAADCKQPQVFCVGLVTQVGRRNDRSYNQAAWEGIQQARSNGTATWIAAIETVDARDYEENINVFAEAGYDVIVTVESAMTEATQTAASAFPDSYFIGVDQDQSTSQSYTPNLSGLVFPEDQIGFLAGAFAVLMSKSGQVGAVGASDAVPAIRRYGEGFLAGAASINPQVNAAVTYDNAASLDQSFDDPEWAADTANALVNQGVDLLFGVGGSTGNNAIVAAVRDGAYAIGADIDQYYALPVAAPHLYVSVLKMIAPGVAELIKVAREAQTGESTFPQGNTIGQVGLSPYHDLGSSVPDKVKTRMSNLSQSLNSGGIITGVAP